MAQHQYRFSKNDEYYTPAYAVYPIMKRLKPKSTIWCPFDTKDSNYVKVFEENGFSVIHTHIADGEDFFEQDVPECDYIISNPPFSMKDEIFKRLYEFEKPFAMLINVQGLSDSKNRFEMFSKNRFEILLLYPRVSFSTIDNSKLSSVPFQSGYVCSGICGNLIEFEYLNKEDK